MAIAERRGFRRRGRRFLAAALLLAFTTAEPSAVCAVICSITDAAHGADAIVTDDMPCHPGTTAVHAPQVPTGMLSVALHSAPLAFVPPDVPPACVWRAPRPTSATAPEILPPPPRA